MWVLEDDAELGRKGRSQTVILPIALPLDDESRKFEVRIDYLGFCPSYSPFLLTLLFITLDVLVQFLTRPESFDIAKLVDAKSGLGERHLGLEFAEGQNVRQGLENLVVADDLHSLSVGNQSCCQRNDEHVAKVSE